MAGPDSASTARWAGITVDATNNTTHNKRPKRAFRNGVVWKRVIVVAHARESES
jgi:hypothetical protein